MSDLLPNALHVARREYLFRVRGRTFIITTALIAIAVAAATMLPTILGAIGVGEPPEVAVYVEADDLSTDAVLAIQAVLMAGANLDAVGEGEIPDVDEAGSAGTARVTRTDDPEAAAEAVRNEELDGLLTIRRGESGDLEFEYLSDASPTDQTRILITQAANAIAISDRLERAGISAGESAELFAPPDFTAVSADPDARDEEDFGGATGGADEQIS